MYYIFYLFICNKYYNTFITAHKPCVRITIYLFNIFIELCKVATGFFHFYPINIIVIYLRFKIFRGYVYVNVYVNVFTRSYYLIEM